MEKRIHEIYGMDKLKIFINNDNTEIGNDVHMHFNYEKNQDDYANDDDRCDNEEYNIY